MKLMTTKYGVARAVRRVLAATLRPSRLAASAAGAPAAGSGPYSLDAEALFSPSRTDLHCSSVDLTYRRSWRRFRSRPGTSARMSQDPQLLRHSIAGRRRQSFARWRGIASRFWPT